MITGAGEDPTIIEYLKEPPNRETIQRILQYLGISALDLVRTKEPAFAALNLNADDIGEEVIIDAMIAHPILIERPIVVAEGKAVIGRPPENVLAIIGQ